MTARHLTFLVLLLMAIFMPWWMSLAFMIGAILFFTDFFEALIILFIIDLIYGAGLVGWRGSFALTFGGLIFILAVEAGRKALLMRN